MFSTVRDRDTFPRVALGESGVRGVGGGGAPTRGLVGEAARSTGRAAGDAAPYELPRGLGEAGRTLVADACETEVPEIPELGTGDRARLTGDVVRCVTGEVGRTAGGVIALPGDLDMSLR